MISQLNLRNLNRAERTKIIISEQEKAQQEAQLKAEQELQAIEQAKRQQEIDKQNEYINGINLAIADSKNADWRYIANESEDFQRGYQEILRKYYSEQARYGSIATTLKYGTPAEQERAINIYAPELKGKEYDVDIKTGQVSYEVPIEEKQNNKTGSQEFAEQVEKYKREGMKSYRPPTKVEIVKDVLTGIGQTTTGIARFEQQAFTKFLAGGTLIGKEQAQRDYGLNQTDIENIYGNKTIVSGSDIINYKYFKPTAIEEKELGTAGKIAQAGTILTFVGVGGIGSYKSYKTYRSTGATKKEAVKSIMKDTFEAISPFKPKTSEVVIKSGTPREVKKSLEFSKTQYTDKGIITNTKSSKLWEIPTEVQIKYAPTLFGEVKPPKTIATLKNYQYIDLSGKFRTTSFGNQFVTTGNVGRKVLTYQEIPEKVTQFGITKRNVLDYNLQVGTGGGFSQQVKKGMISNILKGKPYRADVNTFKKSLDLNSQVIEGLTEVKLSYPEGKEAYSFLGKGKGISFGSGEFKFKNLATAKYEFATKQTPAKFSFKLFPAGRSSIARGYSISAPTEIFVDIKKLPDEKGEIKDFMLQLTKSEGRATLFSKDKFIISTDKSIDISKTPFSLSGGGGRSASFGVGGSGDSVGMVAGEFGGFAEGSSLKNIKMFEDISYLSNIGFSPISKTIQSPSISTTQIRGISLVSILPAQAQGNIQTQAQNKAQTNFQTQAKVQAQTKILTPVNNVFQTEIQTNVQTQAKTQAQVQAQVQAKAQAKVQAQTKAPLSIIIPRNVPKPKKPVSPPPIIIKDSLLKRLSRRAEKSPDLFSVTSRRFGKDIEIFKTRSQSEAESLLKRTLKGTLGRSGKIFKNNKALEFSELKGFGGVEFRSSKKDKSRIVQTAKYSLSSAGEKKEIAYFKKKKGRSLWL